MARCGSTAGVVRIVPSRLPQVEAVEADTARAFGRHVHEQFGVGCILRGSQRSASGRGQVQAQAGDLITVNPGEVHDGQPVGDAGRSWRMLYLDPAWLNTQAEDLSEGRHGHWEFSLPVLREPGLAVWFARLYRAFTDPGAGTGALAGEEALCTLLARLGHHRLAPQRLARPAGLQRARQLLDDASAESLSLATLAREAGLSRFHFLRAFAQATGLTPHAYQMQRRLGRARRMIAAGHRLADTAAACGFVDQSHLNRLFMRCYGLTPGRYRQAVLSVGLTG
ncbi:AraC family transcriptional regulator [Ideonella sp. B7]|uniref:AraC family transcriptional regulator n=1 Tax=Ideonella benzenivorans TaxID=2831643 RepID=UPI001CEC605F|nr:AraC family transcriptional regulator [Ideonella benzenivorans]MCA6216758.1 AraC family transcriptional regulator [Ideonella benzenivorans]